MTGLRGLVLTALVVGLVGQIACKDNTTATTNTKTVSPSPQASSGDSLRKSAEQGDASPNTCWASAMKLV